MSAFLQKTVADLLLELGGKVDLQASNHAVAIDDVLVKRRVRSSTTGINLNLARAPSPLMGMLPHSVHTSDDVDISTSS